MGAARVGGPVDRGRTVVTVLGESADIGSHTDAGEPALSEFLGAPEVRLSGLRTEGGAVILKVEQGDATMQMRIADGETFDPQGGVDLRLPVALDLKMQLRRTADLWPIGASPRKSPAQRT